MSAALISEFVSSLPVSVDHKSVSKQLKRVALEGATQLKFVNARLTRESLERLFQWLRENAAGQFALIQSIEFIRNKYPLDFGAGLLDGLVSLRHVKIKSMIVAIPVEFEHLPSLQKIEIQNCGHESLGDIAIRNCPNIKVLDFKGNQISFIPEGFFDQFPRLETINLYMNKLPSSLPLNVFRDLLNLKDLRLGLMTFDLREGRILNLPSLEYLQVGEYSLYDDNFLKILGSRHLKFIGNDVFCKLQCYYYSSGLLTLRMIRDMHPLVIRYVHPETFSQTRYSYDPIMRILANKKVFLHAEGASMAVAAAFLGRADAVEYPCFKLLKDRAGAGEGASRTLPKGPELSLPFGLKKEILSYVLALNPLEERGEDPYEITVAELANAEPKSEKAIMSAFYNRVAPYAPRKKRACLPF